jgi:hypothetical protein
MTSEVDSSCTLQDPPVFPTSNREAWKLKEEAENNLKALFSELVGNDETLDLSDGDSDTEAKRELHRKNVQQFDRFLFEYGLTVENIKKKIDTSRRLTFDELKEIIEREWELTRKEQVLAQMNVQRIMASLIPGGCPEKPFGAIMAMQDWTVQKLCDDVASKLREALDKLREDRNITIRHGNANSEDGGGNIKFALTKAVFGEIEEYHKGLVDTLGFPNPNLMEAIKHEHCCRDDSHNKFHPGNYENVETTPYQCETHPRT